MTIKLRPGDPGDAEACGRICFEAFGSIAAAHGFPSDFPSPEVASELLSVLLGHPGFYSVLAEIDGQVVGSNFLDLRSPIAGVGPVTVASGLQDRGVGRLLMEDVLGRAEDRGAPGVRLVQAAYHARSLSLYAKLGFDVQELLVCLQGPPPRVSVPGYAVRLALAEDVPACDALCRRVHGFDRHGELEDAIGQGTALVVEHDGRISGYSTALAFFGHSVAESNEGLKALLAAPAAYAGPGFLLPATNSDVLSWCLVQGLQVVQLMTLMTLGLYKYPAGAYLPSILY